MAKLTPTAASASLLRALPSVDQLLRTDEAILLRSLLGDTRIAALARLVTAQLRREIYELSQATDQARAESPVTRETLLAEAVQRIVLACRREGREGIHRVINATGVVIHTNLGRAPLPAESRSALAEASGYCSLEFEIASGARGRRGARVEQLLMELTGAEDALVVNNCAAAALLILTVLARDGETVVSRGELVEIGGDFRVPDVMACSGTRMVEVGTTNRTKLDDYRRALSEQSRLIMRVHQSNYRIVGFTAAPTIAELSLLAREAGVPLYEDAGSGALSDLSALGLADEPVISESIANGADVVSFSGDKLVGACQAGLIVGRRELVTRLREHALFRALRADKLSLGVLEATLESHRRGAAVTEVPVLRMLSQTREQLSQRANDLVERYRNRQSWGLTLATLPGVSAVGGGAGPNTHPPTTLIAVEDVGRTADELSRVLRLSIPPIICRIANDQVLIDLRTVAPHEETELLDALVGISRN